MPSSLSPVSARFLSTLSLRRATGLGLVTAGLYRISIHALLAESDPDGVVYVYHNKISIHALLAESDRQAFQHPVDDVQFLSTLSLRRATITECRCQQVDDISIHALLAESDAASDRSARRSLISIHALLAESDSTCPGS